ncbi:MAG: hypothetical protein K8S56_02335 [Candidatus Cloacimonetes bacterium]|nr:hypothetical protein [Candidatus Cloacimonadota bacterium]
MKKSFLIIISIIILFSLSAEVSLQQLESDKSRIDNFKRKIYNRTTEFIRSNPESPDLPFLYYQLASLSADLEGLDNPGITASYYKRILELDPLFSDRDVVLYNIAYFQWDSAKKARDNGRLRNISNNEMVMNWPDSLRLNSDTPEVSEAIDRYNEIFAKHQDSDYHSEVLLRLGIIYLELAFDARVPKKYYNAATLYFDKLVKKENDPLTEKGLFYRAWAYFSNGKYDEAIDDFSKILNNITSHVSTDGRLYYELDAIENMAHSIVEADSNDFVNYSIAADKAKQVLKVSISEDYAHKILQEAIDLKLTNNAPMQAIDFYNAFIDMYPAYPANPSKIDSIITIIQEHHNKTRNNEDPRALIRLQWVRLVDDYSTESEWYKANEQSDTLASQLAIIRTAYEDLFPIYWNRFLDSTTDAAFDEFIELNEAFATFSQYHDEEGEKLMIENRKLIVSGSYSIAERTRNPSKYYIAYTQLKALNSDFPDNEDFVENEVSAFACIENIREILKDSIQNITYVDTIYSIRLDSPSLDSLYVKATKDFEPVLRSDDYIREDKGETLIKIIYERAGIYYNNEKYLLAYEDYEKLLELNPSDEVKKFSYSRLAFLNEREGKYAEAEKFYGDALQYADAEERKKIDSNRLAQIQKKADKLKETSDFLTAAHEYLRLSAEFEEKDIQQSLGYKFKAIDMYNQIPDYQKSIDLWVEMAQDRHSSVSKPNDEDKRTILSYYSAAWGIADTLMSDLTQGVALRRHFVDKFPLTYEAYRLQVDIVKMYEGDPYNDKEKAAVMYLELYANADNLDMGEDTAETLYLSALNLYHDLNMEEKTLEMMLTFEKKYPDHPQANDFLVQVYRIYKDRDENDKMKELASYLYKKDPNLDFLKDIASEELREVFAEANQMFEDKDYAEMRVKISQYKRIEASYSKQGLDLRLEAIYTSFDNWNNYVDYLKKFDSTIAKIETNFLQLQPNEIFRVAWPTKWQQHMVPRLQKLKEKCDSYSEEITQLMRDGVQINLDVEKQTRAFYLIVQVYDKGLKVLQDRMEVFTNNTTQADKFKQQSPLVYQKFVNGVNQQAAEPARYLVTRKAAFANDLYSTYAENKNYEDQYTRAAYDILLELGVKKPKAYVTVMLDANWYTNNSELIGDFADQKLLDYLWSNLSPDTTLTLDGDVYRLTPLSSEFENCIKSPYLKAEILPELMIVDYIATAPVEIIFNDVTLTDVPLQVSDSLQINGLMYRHYIARFAQNAKQGDNYVAFKIAASHGGELFSAKTALQMDKEQLELFRTTEKKILTTDYSWYVKYNEQVDPTTTVTDSTWQFAENSKLSFYKVNMSGLEESSALPIWAPALDSTRVDTVYFLKKLPIDLEFVEGEIQFIGEQKTTIWINGNLMIGPMPMLPMDETLRKVMPFFIPVDSATIKPGENTILVRVVGAAQNKGFIMEMKYTVKKQ